jgi:hypothetical protein
MSLCCPLRSTLLCLLYSLFFLTFTSLSIEKLICHNSIIVKHFRTIYSLELFHFSIVDCWMNFFKSIIWRTSHPHKMNFLLKLNKCVRYSFSKRCWNVSLVVTVGGVRSN